MARNGPERRLDGRGRDAPRALQGIGQRLLERNSLIDRHIASPFW